MRTLHYSSTWIALSGALGCGSAFVQTGAIQWEIALMVFLGIWARYNLTVFGLREAPAQNLRMGWIWRHRKAVKVGVAGAVLGMLALVVKLSPLQILLLGMAGGAGLWYMFPFLGSRPLRRVPYLKPFVIAFAWAFATFLLPWAAQPEWGYYAAFGFAERFLSCFFIPVCFDIQDVSDDREKGLKTIPLLLGPTKTAPLLCFLCVASCGCALYAFPAHRMLVGVGYLLLLLQILLPLKHLYQGKIWGKGPVYGEASLMGFDAWPGVFGAVLMMTR